MRKTTTTLIALLLSTFLTGQEAGRSDSISRIQLCLLLDVSYSMSGLLSQAQNEIWKTITFLEGFKKDSLETEIELAVLSYGNKGYAENGHISLIADFSTKIDEVAEGLWVMETGGGNEFCGQAIRYAVERLSWRDDSDFKCIIMAGNEPFDQGESGFEASIAQARSKGIKLNTVYCGEREKGIYEKWENAAMIGKGAYANIDQGINTDDFKTPYDNSLIQFYYDYRSTYFDEEPEDKNTKLSRFDAKGEVPPAFRDRIIYKFGRLKKEKDLIDKFHESNWQLNEFNDAEIPEQWRNLDKRALKFRLLEYSRKRNTYREGFETYRQKVEDFLRASVQEKLQEKTLDLALKEMISEQLIELGYREEIKKPQAIK